MLLTNRLLVAVLLVLGSATFGCGSNNGPAANPPRDSAAETGAPDTGGGDTGGGSDSGADTGADTGTVADAGVPMDAAPDVVLADCTVCTAADTCLMSLIEGGISTLATSCNGATSPSTRQNIANMCQQQLNLYCARG